MPLNRKRRRIILTALFTALAVVLGYALAAVPNVELMTLCVFLSGVYNGVFCGAVTGVLSITFYSLFNPHGSALPPLLGAQIIGFLLAGAAGGLLRGVIRKRGMLAAAVSGLFITLIYDILTTLASAYIALGEEGFLPGIKSFFAASAIFILIHAGVNTLIFSQAVTASMKLFDIDNEYAEY